MITLAPGCSRHEAVPTFDPEAAVDAWGTLWNTYDLSLVDELFVTDSTVTYFSSEREGLITGIDAVRAHHARFGFVRGGGAPERDLRVEDLHATVARPAAIVKGIRYFGERSGDVTEAQRGPLTFVYVEKRDRYRLAHLHFSEYSETVGEGAG